MVLSDSGRDSLRHGLIGLVPGGNWVRLEKLGFLDQERDTARGRSVTGKRKGTGRFPP